MCCEKINDLNSIVTAWGPFIAALITGIITILAVRLQNKTSLKAAKTQSDSTIETMNKSLMFQEKSSKLAIFQSSLADLLMNLYLFERGGIDISQSETLKPLFNAIAKFQSVLSLNQKEKEIMDLLAQIRSDIIERGDLSNFPALRKSIETKSCELISEIDQNK